MDAGYKLGRNVVLGDNVIIGDACIIGITAKGKNENECTTIIGDNAYIRSHTIIYADNNIGHNFQTGHHVVIRETNSIGTDVSIGSLSCVEHHVTIEDGVRIHSQAFIPEYSVLKRECWIGPNVVLTNARYPRSRNVKENLSGAVIEEKAKIGANVTILPGIRIGREALVGAGSVVTRDVPPFAVVAGNPARVISDVREIEQYKEEGNKE